jgi:hypothetical protein
MWATEQKSLRKCKKGKAVNMGDFRNSKVSIFYKGNPKVPTWVKLIRFSLTARNEASRTLAKKEMIFKEKSLMVLAYEGIKCFEIYYTFQKTAGTIS